MLRKTNINFIISCLSILKALVRILDNVYQDSELFRDKGEKLRSRFLKLKPLTRREREHLSKTSQEEAQGR